MYIYLKKNAALEESVTISNKFKEICQFLGKNLIYSYEDFPHIDLNIEDFEILKENKKFPEFFLKATIINFPEYAKSACGCRREMGVYLFGKAKAELTPGSNSPYWLKIETSSWEGIADMKTLQEKLWAGTITPTISYGGKQKGNHLLDILARILDSRHLGSIQRFFLALRLAKPKK